MDVLEILCPQPCKVRILGEEHELKRLRYACVFRLVSLFAEALSSAAEDGLNLSEFKDGLLEGVLDIRPLLAVVLSGSRKAPEIMDLAFAESLPELKDRLSDLPLEPALELFVLIWKENRIAEAFKRFFTAVQEKSPERMRAKETGI